VARRDHFLLRPEGIPKGVIILNLDPKFLLGRVSLYGETPWPKRTLAIIASYAREASVKVEFTPGYRAEKLIQGGDRPNKASD
jgi:hypothetical protein